MAIFFGDRSSLTSFEICAFISTDKIAWDSGGAETGRISERERHRSAFLPEFPEGGNMSKKETAGKSTANRNYKDTVFRMLFKDRGRLLGLYNAVSGRSYADPEELEIATLENAVYMGMKNDLAFLVDLNLYLFEHQSTVNRNMPLRFLQYVSAEYEKLAAGRNIYRDRLIQIPAPHFIVFYNGSAYWPEQRELRLSDAFLTKEDVPELELLVKVLNINSGYNEELKGQCRTLKEYMQYVEKVRSYTKAMAIGEAVERAVEECIGQNILREFLLQNKAEVKKMSIYEYDEETARRVLKEDAYEEGKIEGRLEGKIEGDLQRLVSQVCKKLKKNRSLEMIAENLEEELSVIEPIYDAAREFAPEYDPDLVYERVSKQKKREG